MKPQEFIETRKTNHSAERHRVLLELNNAIITNLTEDTMLPRNPRDAQKRHLFRSGRAANL